MFDYEKNKKLTISYSILSWIFILGIIILLLGLFVLPFPERFTFAELDPICVQGGQGITLAIFYIGGPITAIIGITYILIGGFLFYYSAYKETWFYKEIKNKLMIWFIAILILLSSVFFPFIAFGLYIKNLKFMYYQDEQKLERLLFKKNQNNKISALTIVTPILLTAMVATPVLCSKINNNSIFINENKINNFLKLSNTNDNTLMLYFDRAEGMIWNSLLWYDYEIYKDKSFVSLFPEFTTYLKSISQGRQTSTSNPSLIAGHLYSSWMISENEENPYPNSRNFNDNSISSFWSDAFYNHFNMLKSKGIKNINISSVPYYSYNGVEYGEPSLFNEAINKVNNDNSLKINLTTNEAISSEFLNYTNNDRVSNAYVLKNASNLVSFNNQESTYTGWYFHHTHEKYCYYDYSKNEYITDNSYIGFIKSQWFSIQAIKELFWKLKKEPHKMGGSVYDNTQIIIVSDHGYSITKEDQAITKLLEYIEKENNLEPFNPVKKSLLAWDNIFMYKSFHENKKEFSYDNKNFIISSDLPLILENALNKIHNIDSLYFYPDLNIFKNQKLKNYFNQLIVKDPLNNIESLNNRSVILELSDWRFSTTNKYKTILKVELIDKSGWGYKDLFSSIHNYSDEL